MESKYKYFNVKISEKIAEVIINRPDKSNAFNEPCWEELKIVFDALSESKDVRVIILTSKSKNFSAGMDLNTLMGLPARWNDMDESGKRDAIGAFIRKIQACISSIEQCTKPVIAGVRGACIGGALSIITACDMIYASNDSYFSLKEAELGIVPDIGALQRMPLFVSPGILAELAYTARNFSAEEALNWGLLNAAYPSPEEMISSVRETAADIASKSPLVIRGVKKMIRYKRSHTVEESLEKVAEYNSEHLLSEDLAEAMMAYISKRPPVFND